MYKLAQPFCIHVLSPLHAGSGSDLGVVDLPIQRERHTDFPKIEGSSMKGGIREAFEELSELNDTKTAYVLRETTPSVQRLQTIFQKETLAKEWQNTELEKKNIKGTAFQQAIDLVFGPDTAEGANLHAGALGISDARLLLFPVKSMKGVFAWITCPMVLQKVEADLNICDKDAETFTKKDGTPIKIADWESSLKSREGKGFCAVVNSNKEQLAINGNVLLEEYAFQIQDDIDAAPIAEAVQTLTGNTQISEKLVILSNDDFRDFVMLSTEVITRTKIDNTTGTVQSGALFTEEFLPAESILYALALATPVMTDNSKKGVFGAPTAGKQEEDLVMDFFTQGLPEVLQLGGDATIGKGLVTTYITGRTSV